MVDIFSKREGPRLEDVKARRLLTQNAGTIRKLADQISNGGFSKMQADQAKRAPNLTKAIGPRGPTAAEAPLRTVGANRQMESWSGVTGCVHQRRYARPPPAPYVTMGTAREHSSGTANSAASPQ